MTCTFKPALLALAVSLGLSMPAGAQVQEGTAGHAQPHQVPPGYVVSQGDTYWRFLMGPAAAPDESMIFYHDPAPEEGGLSLACRRGSAGGAVDMVAIAPIAPLGLPPGTKVDISLTVLGEVKDMPMYVMKGGIGLVAQGPAPIAIMTRIGDLLPGTGGSISATYKGQLILANVVPQDHEIATNVAQICRQWAISP